MGAVLGIAAFGRTQEKLGGANNGGIQTPTTGFASGPSTFGQPAAGGFGNTAGGFGATPTSTANSFGGGSFGSTPTASTGFGAATVTPTPGMPGANRRPMGPAQPIDSDYMPPRD
jgi:hypothetical protein